MRPAVTVSQSGPRTRTRPTQLPGGRWQRLLCRARRVGLTLTRRRCSSDRLDIPGGRELRQRHTCYYYQSRGRGSGRTARHHHQAATMHHHAPSQTPPRTPNTCPPVPTRNAFSLQLNTQFFPTPACQGVAGCQGWQQFVFSQDQCDGPCVFMEYWLLNFGPRCPTGPWIQSGNDCFFNSSSSSAPAVPAAELQGTTLTGTAAEDTDTVVLTTAGGAATAAAADSVLNLAQAWNAVEWNIFGDCCLSQANFSAGSTLVVRASVNAGANFDFPPTCVREGFTGETNNLFLGAAPALVPASMSPALVPTSTLQAIVFTETNAADRKPASCTGTVAVSGRP